MLEASQDARSKNMHVAKYFDHRSSAGSLPSICLRFTGFFVTPLTFYINIFLVRVRGLPRHLRSLDDPRSVFGVFFRHSITGYVATYVPFFLYWIWS